MPLRNHPTGTTSEDQEMMDFLFDAMVKMALNQERFDQTPMAEIADAMMQAAFSATMMFKVRKSQRTNVNPPSSAAADHE